MVCDAHIKDRVLEMMTARGGEEVSIIEKNSFEGSEVNDALLDAMEQVSMTYEGALDRAGDLGRVPRSRRPGRGISSACRARADPDEKFYPAQATPSRFTRSSRICTFLVSPTVLVTDRWPRKMSSSANFTRGTTSSSTSLKRQPTRPFARPSKITWRMSCPGIWRPPKRKQKPLATRL